MEDVYGYMPSDAQIDEGGYEAEGYVESFSCGNPKKGAWGVILSKLGGT
jgi:hypothetical protein